MIQYELDIEVTDPTNKLRAIKAMRTMCSPQLGLKESKDIIEAAMEQFHYNYIMIVTSNTQLVIALLMWLRKNQKIDSETTRTVWGSDIRSVKSFNKPIIHI